VTVFASNVLNTNWHLSLNKFEILIQSSVVTSGMYFHHHHHHHHHHWLNSPTWALAFLRSFCQLKYPVIASSDFVARVFSRVELSAPHPTPGYPGGLMFSVRVVSLS
jgi:hypothetical protein